MEKKVKSKKKLEMSVLYLLASQCRHESSLRYIKAYENRKIVMYILLA